MLKSGMLLLVLSGLMLMAGDRYDDALKQEGRFKKDLERDARSQPAEILRFLGVNEGDHIADIFGGSGYYSELLSNLVGQDGMVYLHNNKAYLPYVEKDLTARLEGDRLPRVIRHDREADALDLKPSSLDSILMVMSYHDIYHESEGWKIDGPMLFKQLRAALKAGGRLLVIDHAAKTGTGPKSAQELHRIEEAFAKKDIEAQGFRFIKDSALLRNPEDDLDQSVFAKDIRGKTDRFVLLFEKK